MSEAADRSQPFEFVVNEINRCMRAGLPYAAIHMALSLPDVCSSLETEPNDDARYRVEKRYVSWCERYLSRHYQNFSPADCWALRGGVLHNGIFGAHGKSRYDDVLFGLPGSPNRIHDGLSTNNGGTNLTALFLDSEMFCESMIKAAGEWLEANKDDAVVAANLPKLVSLRGKGVFPHAVGLPVIA